MKETIEIFFENQLSDWKAAADSYAALAQVQTKTIIDPDSSAEKHLSTSAPKAQYNPARIRSTGAKMDPDSLRSRPCFLCKFMRPIQQKILNWGNYDILVNPYPIFPKHFTIAAKSHSPQRIYGRIADMALLAQQMIGYTVFYNGPRCGASAPDHMHFQAGNSDFLPIWDEIASLAPAVANGIEAVTVFGSLPVIIIRADSAELTAELFSKVYKNLPLAQDEPMLNILMRYVPSTTKGTWTTVVIPRRRHRPSFYGEGPRQMVLSPASVDLAGVFITPRKEDFDRLDADIVKQVYAELCLSAQEVDKICQACNSPEEPLVNVGLLSAPKITFSLHGRYLLDGDIVSGKVELQARNVKDPIEFLPLEADAYAEVEDVTIGVNFHWERNETQCFQGALRVVRDADQLVLINIIPIEDYLKCVISSEMSATSSLELLKAHAVISRSWVLAQIRGAVGPDASASPEGAATVSKAREDATPHSSFAPHERRIVWYDHTDHTLFDVCADDHCQRYQGITRATTPTVNEAIEATRSEVLLSEGMLCDTRFSKCCGGIMEVFETCWADTPKKYLQARRDYDAELNFPNMRFEEKARQWILSRPNAFCNTTDTKVLGQVLNNYDQETSDFYRWTVEYDDETLSELLSRKTGVDFGHIIGLLPIERGTSGRISLLRIVGEKASLDVGKELEIRRILSETHLYSSAFVVERLTGGFRLLGAGWGHGVGLCQIGAAMMADRGYDYRKILAHYYPDSEIANY